MSANPIVREAAPRVLIHLKEPRRVMDRPPTAAEKATIVRAGREATAEPTREWLLLTTN
jgi:hypothetical protein